MLRYPAHASMSPGTYPCGGGVPIEVGPNSICSFMFSRPVATCGGDLSVITQGNAYPGCSPPAYRITLINAESLLGMSCLPARSAALVIPPAVKCSRYPVSIMSRSNGWQNEKTRTHHHHGSRTRCVAASMGADGGLFLFCAPGTCVVALNEKPVQNKDFT